MNVRIVGAGLAALTITVGGCATTAPEAGSPSTATSTPGVPSSGDTAGGTPSVTAPPSPSATRPAPSAVLSGTRQVTVVRVGSTESGLTLSDDGRLVEADDDSGRQLFVPTPQRGGTFLVEAYRGAGGGAPLCWQVRNPGETRPLSVTGAACAPGDPRQQFEIVPAAGGDDRTYVISNRSAFLRHSARNGLILEELGDGAPTDAFRFTDNGPAPD